MKICAAQLQPEIGAIAENHKKHLAFIKHATKHKADVVVFPELSLTGYDSSIAAKAAVDPSDQLFEDYQALSREHNITIALGTPTKSHAGIHISMLIFEPGEAVQLNSKQYLHDDELPYFTAGTQFTTLKIKGHTIAPAICYESLLPEHAAQAVQRGADFYMTSVAKSEKGVIKAFNHYPHIARQYNMPVLMVNNIGRAEDFISAGQSAAWNKTGKLRAKLPVDREGILVYDTETDTALTEVFV